jgi:NADH-quinone oxidoreductase subunit M
MNSLLLTCAEFLGVNQLLLLLVVPVMAIGLILCKAPAKPVALAAALLNLAVALALFFGYVSGPGYAFETNLVWFSLPGPIDVRFHVGVDGISLPMILLATIVTVSAVAVSPSTLRRAKEFYIYVLLISLGAIGAFVSLDLFFLYIFHEFALIPTFLLIGIWGVRPRKQFASTQLTLYLALGSLILLAGLIALVAAVVPVARATSVAAAPLQSLLDLPFLYSLLQNQPLAASSQLIAFPLLLMGFGILVSLFPFHSWAPAGYAAAPPAAAMLHAGVLKKFGLFGLIRVAYPLLPVGAHSVCLQNIVLVLLLGNILYVGLVTLAQKELPTLLGFSSVMHMGYLFLGVAAWNVTGVSGVILLMVGHGLSAALLFGLAGEIQQRTGESRMAELGGLASKAPFLAVCFVIGSMASVGLPGLANFSGEILIFFGAWQGLPGWVTVGALWGVVLSSVYQLRAVRRTLFGERPAKWDGFTDLQGFLQQAPYVLLVAATLLIGFWPRLLLDIIRPSVELLPGIGK